MSVEEDTELRDLVSQALENNGVLAKIRAELRASVFLAVEEQESHLSKTPFANNALKEYLSTSNGALGLCLVKEFLEYLELDFTISVFNSETLYGKDYEYGGRSKLLKDLQIKNINGKKGPLLAHVLHIAQQCSETHSIVSELKVDNSEHINKNMESFVSVDESNTLNNCLQNHKANSDSPNFSVSPLDRTYTTESSHKGVDSADDADVEKPNLINSPLLSRQSQDTQHRHRLQSDLSIKYSPESNNISNEDTKSSRGIGKDAGKGNVCHSHSEESGEIKENSRITNAEKKERRIQVNLNSMTSLNNLPPIDGIQFKREGKISTIGILTDEFDSQENYEEDFQSTGSSAVMDENSKSGSQSQHSSNKPSKETKDSISDHKVHGASAKDASDKGFDSPSICEEIDQDTNSEVDDLLNSTASGESTVEATISHVTSTFADYCENV